MEVLIDTNIVLDAILKRSPFDVDAYDILKMADEKLVNAHIAAFSITDIYYFISKKLDHEGRIKAIKAIKAIFNIANVVSINKRDIEKAMTFPEFNDLEDALQMQCLNKVKGDYIITRDTEFLKICSKAILPMDFIRSFKRNCGTQINEI